MKIGILGGSFNPIHNSHIRIIKILLKKSLVDEVWLVPCKKHAFDKELASAENRIAMIKLAIKNIPDAKICRIELKSKGKNYTIGTIRKLKKRHKNEFFFIAGSDILCEIKKWHSYKQLFNELEFIIFKRKGYPLKRIIGMKILYIASKKRKDISSTETRERIREGKSIKDLVPLALEKYIKRNKLYR